MYIFVDEVGAWKREEYPLFLKQLSQMNKQCEIKMIEIKTTHDDECRQLLAMQKQSFCDCVLSPLLLVSYVVCRYLKFDYIILCCWC